MQESRDPPSLERRRNCKMSTHKNKEKMYTVLFILGILVFLYLIYVLVRPEKF